MHRIICVNPVLDLIYDTRRDCIKGRYFFDNVILSGGGFGPNVARALKCMGAGSECHLILGGMVGELLRKVLNREALAFRKTGTRAETRVASQWLTGQETRMLVSPSPKIDPRAVRRSFSQLEAQLATSGTLFIGGSAPVGSAKEYVRLTMDLCRRHEYCCVDMRTSRWREILPARPFVLKVPNDDPGSHSLQSCVAALEETADAGIPLGLCSVSPTYLLVRTARKLYHLKAPKTEVVNPLGQVIVWWRPSWFLYRGENRYALPCELA